MPTLEGVESEDREWWHQWAKQLGSAPVEGNADSVAGVKGESEGEGEVRNRHPSSRRLDDHNPGHSFPSVDDRGGSEGRSID